MCASEDSCRIPTGTHANTSIWHRKDLSHDEAAFVGVKSERYVAIIKILVLDFCDWLIIGCHIYNLCIYDRMRRKEPISKLLIGKFYEIRLFNP